MITFRKPSKQFICDYLRAVADAPYTYDAIGCVARAAATPAGFKRDAAKFLLGHGPAAWEAARTAIQDWAIFPSDLVSMVRLNDEIRPGTVVAVLCQAMGLWTINPARILSTVDSETSALRRYGFTYGTLPGHVESGEERFCVEWDQDTDEVFYLIDAVSRPKHPLVWLGYPYTRMMQARFRQLSGKSVRDFVLRNARAAEVEPARQPLATA